jgi:flagellar basal body-associated protein FliL
MNKKLILIPLLIIGGGILAGVSGFMFLQSSTVEATETDEFQDNVELVQNEKEGKDFYIEIHDGVGSSDSLN